MYFNVGNYSINSKFIYYIRKNTRTVNIGTVSRIYTVELKDFEDNLEAEIQANDDFYELQNYGYINLSNVRAFSYDEKKISYVLKYINCVNNIIISKDEINSLDDSLFNALESYTPTTGGGTGGGGASTYAQLKGKPKINNVELKTTNTLDELGIAGKDVLDLKADKTEITALKNKDTDLEQKINTNTQSITDEQTKRANKDTELETNITNIETEYKKADTEINTKIGNIDDLETTEKEIVKAINEVKNAQAQGGYTLPTATDTKLGGVKVNGTNGIAITQEGLISVDKASINLDKVENTADADKEISTKTQAALDLKLNKDVVEKTITGTEDKIPNSKAIKEELGLKANDAEVLKTDIFITAIEDDDTKISSSKAVKDALDLKANDTDVLKKVDLITTLEDNETKISSSKTVKDAIELKANAADVGVVNDLKTIKKTVVGAINEIKDAQAQGGYTLPIATDADLGGVIVSGTDGIIIDNKTGKISLDKTDLFEKNNIDTTNFTVNDEFVPSSKLVGEKIKEMAYTAGTGVIINDKEISLDTNQFVDKATIEGLLKDKQDKLSAGDGVILDQAQKNISIDRSTLPVLVYADANQRIPQNTIVIHANALYICKNEITSTAGWNTDEINMIPVDTDTNEIEVIDYTTLQQNEEIKKGKLVVYNDKLYLAKETFNKGAQFADDEAKLIGTALEADFSQYYQKDKVDELLTQKAPLILPTITDQAGYKKDQLVLKGDGYLYRVTADITAYTQADDEAKLQKVTDLSTYALKTDLDDKADLALPQILKGQPYKEGQLALYKNKLVKINTAIDSFDKTADETKIEYIGYLEIATADVLGGVKLGDGIEDKVADGKISIKINTTTNNLKLDAVNGLDIDTDKIQKKLTAGDNIKLDINTISVIVKAEADGLNDSDTEIPSSKLVKANISPKLDSAIPELTTGKSYAIGKLVKKATGEVYKVITEITAYDEANDTNKISEFTTIKNSNSITDAIVNLTASYEKFINNFAVNATTGAIFFTEDEYNAIGTKEADKLYIIKQ